MTICTTDPDAGDEGIAMIYVPADAPGLSPEYHLEKYLRDAKITQLWLAGQQVARYRVVRGYYDYVVGKPS